MPDTMADVATESEIENLDLEDEPLQIEAKDRRVKTEKQDVPIETIRQWTDRGKLNVQPDFQRQYVWTRTKASRLIESILLEIPLPVIYVAENGNRSFEVVDGQQRITSIASFVDGRFPDGATFRLSGLQVLKELNGESFQDLDEVQREAILGCTLRLIVLSRDSHPDVKFEVFERLNSGAVRLNNQELRNCMYRGPLNQLIRDLATNEHLLKIRKTDDLHPKWRTVISY